MSQLSLFSAGLKMTWEGLEIEMSLYQVLGNFRHATSLSCQLSHKEARAVT